MTNRPIILHSSSLICFQFADGWQSQFSAGIRVR